MRLRACRGPIIVALLLGAAATLPAADVDKLLRKGDEALAAGRLADAEAAYRKGLERSPLHPLLHLDLGIVLVKQGRGEEGYPAAPGGVAGAGLGRLLLAHRHPDRPGTLERVPGHGTAHGRDAPHSVDALDRLAMCAENSGDHATAAEALRRAVAIEDLVDRQRWLAWAEYGNGDFAGAARAAERALDMGPSPQVDPAVAESNRADLEYVLGLAELALGNLPEARRWLGDRPAIGVRVEVLADGLRVTQVFHGMPADRAGVRRGDVITACNGVAIGQGRPDLTDLLRVQPKGAEVKLSLRRGNETLEAVAPLALAAPEPSPPLDVAGDDQPAESGLRVHTVLVEPASVAVGSSFRIVVELSARTASDAVSVPVRLDLRILQGETELTRSDWTEEVITGGRRRLVKEVPRAAGSPGRYTVAVHAESPAGSSEGSAEFAIVE